MKVDLTQLDANAYEERARPEIKRACKRCKPDLDRGAFIVSPRGLAHHGTDDGWTMCGHDATGRDWWWPL